MKNYINYLNGGSGIDYKSKDSFELSKILNILKNEINREYIGKGTNKKVFDFKGKELNNYVLSLEIVSHDRLEKAKEEIETNIKMFRLNIGPEMKDSYIINLDNFTNIDLENIVRPIVQDTKKDILISDKKNLYLIAVISEKLFQIDSDEDNSCYYPPTMYGWEKKTPWDNSKNYCNKICDNFENLWNKKYGHGDPKPDNIMKNSKNELRFIDFGKTQKFETIEDAKNWDIRHHGYVWEAGNLPNC